MFENHSEQKTLELEKLQVLLKRNQHIQMKLKHTRDRIKERMNDIDEYISTHRLKVEYPKFNSLLSFLKFERNIPHLLLEQKKIIDTEVFRAKEEDKFINGLNTKKENGRKKNTKKVVDFSELPQKLSHLEIRQLAKEYSYHCGIDFFRDMKEFKNQKSVKMPFVLEEEKIIIAGHKKYGSSWQKIGKNLDDRLFEEIYYEYHNRLNPRLQGGRWNYRQSLMLIVLLQKFGAGKWAAIGEKMVIKSELQIRQRYCNVIDPSIGKDSFWTATMDQQLMQLAPKMDFTWYKISKIPVFKNKTDNCIWRRFRSNLIKKSKEQILKIIPEETHNGLVHKILKFKEVHDSKSRKVPVVERGAVFDPNQRARSNRESLSQGMIQSFNSASLSLNIPIYHSENFSLPKESNQEEEYGSQQ